MKYQFFRVFAFCAILGSCSKTSVEPMAIKTNKLSQDTNFINVVNQERDLLKFISHLAVTKGMTLVELKNKIESLNDKDLNSSNASYLVDEFIGNENVSFLKDYAKKYSNNWNQINRKFNYVSMQQIDTACNQVLSQEINSQLLKSVIIDRIATNSLIEINMLNDCGWKYSLCTSAALATGILCHANCIGLTAGLGTPVCVLLCGTIEAAAGVACIDNYCPLP